MEATKEEKLGFLPTIKPPRMEDAGLEDCALPPHSIHLAFLKAASAVGSRAAAVLTGEKTEGCISDPWIEDPPPSDEIVGGVRPGSAPPGPCVTEKGGAWGGARDLVGGWEGGDDVAVVGEGKKVWEVKKDDDDEDDNKDEKWPTLVEGYLLNS